MSAVASTACGKFPRAFQTDTCTSMSVTSYNRKASGNGQNASSIQVNKLGHACLGPRTMAAGKIDHGVKGALKALSTE